MSENLIKKIQPLKRIIPIETIRYRQEPRIIIPYELIKNGKYNNN